MVRLREIDESSCPGLIYIYRLMLTVDVFNWAIFDLGDHPVPSFHKGRICISGDAAHDTSPRQGAGEGFVSKIALFSPNYLPTVLFELHRISKPFLPPSIGNEKNEASGLSRVVGGLEIVTNG